MSVIEHGWAYQCPDCGRFGQHDKGCGIFPLGIVDTGNRVAVVPADFRRGAVEELGRLRMLVATLGYCPECLNHMGSEHNDGCPAGRR